jgi:hypothetical protein
MNREFQIVALAQNNRFVLQAGGGDEQHEFLSLFEAARHARTERNSRRGLVVVCSYCREVDQCQDYWDEIDSYLMQDSDLKVSHGVCEACFEEQARVLGLPLA